MREGRDSDEVVHSRLRSVLAIADAVPEGGRPAGSPWALPPGAVVGPTAEPLYRAAAVPSAPENDGWPAPGGPPLSWSEVVPGWPDDVDLGPAPQDAPPPAETVLDEPGYRPAWAVAATSAHPSIRPAALSLEEDRPALSLEEDRPAFESHAFEGGLRSRLGAFDPGRRGVRALAAVGVLVVVIAAYLAWRARPRVEPIAPPPVDSVAVDTSQAEDEPVAAGAPESSAPAGVVVAVGGKVRKPGLVQLPSGARVADALQAAGGASPGVDVAPLNLARKVTDGELIMVGVTLAPGAAPTAPAAPGSTPGAGPVNLNTATLADLDTLPGVGPVLAQRILDAREAQGGFKAVADLRKVQGIGSSRYEQLKDLVTV